MPVHDSLSAHHENLATRSIQSDTLSAKLAREGALFQGLPSAVWAAAKDHFTNEKSSLAADAFIGVGTGLTLVAVAKNPAVFGRASADFFSSALAHSGKVFTTLTALDWTRRIGAPVVDTWIDPNNLSNAKNILAQNIATGLVDYGVGLASGATAAGVAHKFYNPKFSPVPVKDTTWHKIYESEFPADERQSYEFFKTLSKPGSMPHVRVHVSRHKSETRAFSMTADYGEGSEGRKLLLPYIAVSPEIQSGGVGTRHLKQMVAELKSTYPTAKGIVLEVENPDIPGIGGDLQAQRHKRINWYQKRDGQVLDRPYYFPSTVAGEPPIAGHLMWIGFGRGELSKKGLEELVHDIYKYGYKLDASDPLMASLKSKT